MKSSNILIISYSMLFLYMCQEKKKRAENQKDETPTSFQRYLKRLG